MRIVNYDKLSAQKLLNKQKRAKNEIHFSKFSFSVFKTFESIKRVKERKGDFMTDSGIITGRA